MALPAQHRLDVVWSEDGTRASPTDTKYLNGWVVELPTFENFNDILYGMDNNIKYSATHPAFKWQPNISYNYGARVEHNNRRYESITGIDESFGTGSLLIDNNLNEDPEVDYNNNGNHWTQGTKFGVIEQYQAPIPSVSPGGYQEVLMNSTLGIMAGDIHKQPSTNLWSANILTLSNENSLIGLYTKNPNFKNWVVGNVEGELVAIDVGDNVVYPTSDDISIDSTSTNVSVNKLFHEGNLDVQVFPFVDSVVQRTDEGDVAANGLNISALTEQVNPTHVLAAVGVGYDKRYLPYPISSIGGGGSTDDGVPIGTVVAYAGLVIPSGWMSCSGYTISIASYPDLYNAIGTAYGSAPSGDFKVPDLRGEFIRGMDLGRGIDPSRALGSKQDDAYKNHDHNYTTVAIGVNFTASNLQILPGTLFYATHPDVENGLNQVHHDTDMSGGDGIGEYGDHDFGQAIDETRPLNTAMKYIIKSGTALPGPALPGA